MFASVIGDTETHQADRAAIADLAQRGQQLAIVEIALVQRLDQAMGPGLCADLRAADRHAEQTYQGTNYTFRIDTAGGDGNDFVLHSLGRSMPGTVMLVF